MTIPSQESRQCGRILFLVYSDNGIQGNMLVLLGAESGFWRKIALWEPQTLRGGLVTWNACILAVENTSVSRQTLLVSLLGAAVRFSRWGLENIVCQIFERNPRGPKMCRSGLLGAPVVWGEGIGSVLVCVGTSVTHTKPYNRPSTTPITPALPHVTSSSLETNVFVDQRDIVGPS